MDARTLYKVLRITAIPLVIAGFLTLLSGFTTTKYFLMPGIGYSLSYFIHAIIFPLVFLPLFFLHSLAGTLIMVGRRPRINKRPVKIFIVVLWFAILGLFVFFYAAQNTTASGNIGINSSLPGTGGTVTLSAAEISRHNTPGDCWIIINNKVYDVTAHLTDHPGGAGLITPYCGQNATAAYDTKGGKGNPHSANADSTLNPIYLGNVGDNVSGQSIQQAKNQTLPNIGNNHEQEDD